jgi:hypothetical protein
VKPYSRSVTNGTPDQSTPLPSELAQVRQSTAQRGTVGSGVPEARVVAGRVKGRGA